MSGKEEEESGGGGGRGVVEDIVAVVQVRCQRVCPARHEMNCGVRVRV